MNANLLCRLALVLSFSSSARAEISPVPPPLSPELEALQPASLLPADLPGAFRLEGAGTMKKVDLPGVAVAFRVETAVKSESAYAVQAQAKTAQAVKKGDACLIRFAARAIFAKRESGAAQISCYFQRSGPPYDKSINTDLSFGPDWTVYELPFVSKMDGAAGDCEVCFSFGALIQGVEIASVEALDFGSRAALAQLPATRFSYAGREENAAWRNDALARIDKIRTAPLKISVVDAGGKPVPNARVEARMTQSAFAFGSAVDARLLDTDTPAAKIYQAKVLELFNTVTFDNALKWPSWLNQERRASTLRAVDWTEAHGLRLRAHNLVWPGWKFLPKELKALPDPAAEIPRRIQSHIEEEVTAIKGKPWAWDVLNEPLHERDLYKLFPESTSADWFKQTRALDPHALLFVNEYSMLNNRLSADFIRRYLTFIKMLQSNGAPLDGIGVQGHLGAQVRDPVDILSDLDLLQTSGLPIQITEFDIETKDEALQADYTRDFLIAIYSHPGVSGFIQWGFWEPAHWKPEAAMFRADWSEKPNARVWRDWVLGRWKTHLDLTTNADGAVVSRGHLGAYEITASHGASSVKQTCQLTHDGAEVLIKLP